MTERERGRRLTPARIVKMVAGEWGTPVGKNADKLVPGNVRLHMSFRKIGEAQALERPFQEEARAQPQ